MFADPASVVEEFARDGEILVGEPLARSERGDLGRAGLADDGHALDAGLDACSGGISVFLDAFPRALENEAEGR